MARSLYLISCALFCLTGCPVREAVTKEPLPQPRVQGPADTVFKARGPLASNYADYRPVRVFGVEGKVLSALTRISRELGKGDVRTDGAAHAMARDICLGLTPSGPPPSKLVNFAMQSYGLTEPPPHFVVADMPFGVENSILSELEPKLREILGQGRYKRAGVALQVPTIAGARRRLLIALLESRVRIKPLPRKLQLGQEVTVEAAPEKGIKTLKLVVAAPDGTITTSTMKDGKGRFSCQARGVCQVELTGEGDYGVEVLANFPVYCDQDPPREVRYTLGGVGAQRADQLERAILMRTNELRLKAGIPALRPNQALARLARLHCVDMRDNAFVGHVSPITGTPSDRLRRGGITHLLARENVARGYSVEEIMGGLINSPAHRENLLSKDVAEVGIGVAIDATSTPPVLLVTQDFIAAGTALRPSGGAGPVLAEIARLRSVAGVGGLKNDPILEAIAGRVVREMVRGGEGAEKRARQVLDRELDNLGESFKQVDSLQAKLTALEALAQAAEVANGRYTHIGLGLADQRGQILLIVLLGIAR